MLKRLMIVSTLALSGLAPVALAQVVPVAETTSISVPKNTRIAIEVLEPVTTRTAVADDTFHFRVTEPVELNGVVAIPAGTMGTGVVLDAAKPGLGGKPGKLVVSGRYIELNGRHVAVQALKLDITAQAHTNKAMIVPIAGIMVAGGHMEIQAGMRGTARLSEDFALEGGSAAAVQPPESEVVPADAATAPMVSDALNRIDPVPAGKAQIVFFRPWRYWGMVANFSVREGDKGIVMLTNGSFAIHLTEPGIKTYNVSSEVEDTLKMDVAAGETYYVVQGLAMGVAVERPYMMPSTEAVFQQKPLKVTQAQPTDRK